MTTNGHGPTPSNGQPGAAPPSPYRKGWRAPWRGQWGPIEDGNSRLGRLADRVERQLVKEYAPATPLEVDTIRQAARWRAIAAMRLERLEDRKAKAALGQSKSLLRPFAARAGKRRPTLPERFASLHAGRRS